MSLKTMPATTDSRNASVKRKVEKEAPSASAPDTSHCMPSGGAAAVDAMPYAADSQPMPQLLYKTHLRITVTHRITDRDVARRFVPPIDFDCRNATSRLGQFQRYGMTVAYSGLKAYMVYVLFPRGDLLAGIRGPQRALCKNSCRVGFPGAWRRL